MVQSKIITGQTSSSFQRQVEEEEEEEPVQTKLISPEHSMLHRQVEGEKEAEKEENLQTKSSFEQGTSFVQRQEEEEEEEEEIQTKSVNEQIRPFVQCQVEEEEEEETLQTKSLIEPLIPFVQRQTEEEEEEEPIQAKSLSEQFVSLIQSQPEEEEEEALQTKSFSEPLIPLVQKQTEEEEEEEEIQTEPFSHQISPLVNRQLEGNEENMAQTEPLFQRQPEEEEEEPVQTKFKTEAVPQLQRQQEEEERDIQANSYQRKQANEEKMPVLEKGGKGDSFVRKSMESRLTMAKGGGSPLPGEIRAFMEPRFGLDFSHVRVHTENDAVQLSRQLNAQAFTHRSDIYFGDNKFKPGTYEGNRLIAHELTHVVQQGAALRPKLFQVTSAPHKIQRSPGPIANLINKVAKNVPGFTLITVIIGKNPITGDAVPRTAKNLLGGFLGLIPGGTALFDKLNKAGAIDEAFSWLQKQIKVMNITWSGIKALISEAWDRISIWYSLSKNLKIIKDIFAPTFGRIIRFASSLGKKVMEFIFKGALRLVGAPVKKIMAILNKGKAVISKIINNPVGFIKNLFNALVKGIRMFCGNIVKHLMSGIAGWLFGTLSKAGITLPEKFDLKGIFFLVAQILDVTWQSIRRRIVKALGPNGEKIMSAIEKAVDFIQDLIKRGPIAIWDRIKKFLGNLKDMIMGAIIDWVKSTIVFKAIEKLISFFNPAGAIIQAVIAIYNVIMFFVNRYNQIIAFAESVFNSIAEIASGNITRAAKAVENAMARALPVMISFLARLIGLGGISAKIRKVIMKIRKPIDKAMNKVIGWVVKKGKKLFGKVMKLVKGGKERIVDWWRKRKKFKAAKEMHTLHFQGKGRSARLMLSTSPTLLKDYMKSIRKRQENKKADKQRIIATIDEKIRQLEKLADASESKTSRTKGASSNVDPEQALNTIAKLLPELMGLDQIGTLENPIEMDWPKYASANYAPLYIAGKSKSRIRQWRLRNAYQKSGLSNDQKRKDEDYRAIVKASNTKIQDIHIQEYKPHEGKGLPDGGPPIGITTDYQVRKNMPLKMENPGATQRGKKINNALLPYGFSPMGERKAGDHIIEMQLGGPNEVENLWPLSFKINSSSGPKISKMKFNIKGKEMKMKELKDKSRSEERPIWFKIRSVLSGSDEIKEP